MVGWCEVDSILVGWNLCDCVDQSIQFTHVYLGCIIDRLIE